MGLFTKIIDSGVEKRQVKEIQSFIQCLAALSDEEMAELVVVTTHVKNGMIDAGNNVMDPHALWMRKPGVIFETSKMAEKLKAERNTAAAAAFTVWAHTLRAAARPALLPLAKLMWREMSRGFPYLLQAETATLLRLGVRVDMSNAEQFPLGFDPRF